VPSMQNVELSWAHGAGQAAERLVVGEGGSQDSLAVVRQQTRKTWFVGNEALVVLRRSARKEHVVLNTC
jgi:hypothetical protein